MLEAFAVLSIARGEANQAARRYGAAAALRDALGTPLAPAYRPRQERHLAAVRAALDESAFSSAWAKGRPLTLEAALDAVPGP